MDKHGGKSKRDESEECGSVKEEPKGETSIKNYAESTMNELLGLFGYEDKVNSTDTENLDLEKYAESKKADDADIRSRDLLSDDDVSTDEASTSTEKLKYKLRHRLRLEDNLAQQHQNLISALKRREHSGPRKGDDSSNAEEDEPTDTEGQCAWCNKHGHKNQFLKTSTGNKIFCSEVCFTQCRRAAFKKNKVCDWCKHIRHTVTYVELQDGDNNLQFCSEKCLNQFKMSIFCKETQEHLTQIQDGSDESVTDKENEREILITPDLWLNGDPIKNQSRFHKPSSKHVEVRDSKDILRKTFSSNIEKSVLKKIPDDGGQASSEASRQALLQRIKSEANMKHRRHFRKEAERLASPTVSDPPSTSPQPPSAGLPPPHLLPPNLAGIAPWIHQAQLLGTMAPGLNPYAAYQSMMLPGLMPPFPPNLVPGPASPDRDKDRDTERSDRKHKPEATTSRQLLSPPAERSFDTGSTMDVADDKTPRPASPSAVPLARRTSSLFPVDFPQMFPNHGFPAGQFPPAMSAQSVAPPTLGSGIPPVTMMIPFPVVLPIPVPIPIPIPLTLDTLYKHFLANRPETASPPGEPRPIRKPQSQSGHESTSPRPLALHSPLSAASSSSDIRHFDRRDRHGENRSVERSPSRNSDSEYRTLISEAFSLKRSHTPDDEHSVDLACPKQRKYDSYYVTSDSNDCVIDLSSKESRNRHMSETSSSDNGLANGDIVDEYEKCSTPGSNDTQPDDVPKIHIITHKDESPLSQHLPLPPTGKSYGTRRGLILDAPTVPKRQRSPSPERRVYVRNVPRDIMEAARRRCIRTRIRTK